MAADLPDNGAIPLEKFPGKQDSILSQVSQHYPKESVALTRERLADLTDEEIVEKCETILTQKIKEGDRHAIFLLGQLHFEMGNYELARKYYERAPETDWQSRYQLGVIHFDGLGLELSDHKAGLSHMMAVAECKHPSAKHLLHGAEFNIARAYFQGFGIRTDYKAAEKWWVKAADDGNPTGSVLAQSMLGLFYSRQDTLDLKKSFFWHSEACGNGSLESQGALGVMYLYGLGTKKNLESAFECLSDASQRGNVYAMGHMIAFYYQRKLYTKCVDMASRVSQLDNVDEIAAETHCQANFIRKGISMACFYYARCLDKQLGIKNSQTEAALYYSRSYELDPNTCASLQNLASHGKI